jgi:lysine 2,3-aminomutase
VTISSSTNSETLAQAEGEPPLGSLYSKTGVEEEEEPPSKRSLTIKERFLTGVSEKEWNDWKWQFRHRITTVEELARYIPLTAKEQGQINLVIKRYPFTVTPYYLSLIHPEDPNDPIKKQAVPCFDEITMADMGEEDPLE